MWSVEKQKQACIHNRKQIALIIQKDDAGDIRTIWREPEGMRKPGTSRLSIDKTTGERIPESKRVLFRQFDGVGIHINDNEFFSQLLQLLIGELWFQRFALWAPAADQQQGEKKSLQHTIWSK
jgi:hypothetical protein